MSSSTKIIGHKGSMKPMGMKKSSKKSSSAAEKKEYGK